MADKATHGQADATVTTSAVTKTSVTMAAVTEFVATAPGLTRSGATIDKPPEPPDVEKCSTETVSPLAKEDSDKLPPDMICNGGELKLGAADLLQDSDGRAESDIASVADHFQTGHGEGLHARAAVLTQDAHCGTVEQSKDCDFNLDLKVKVKKPPDCIGDDIVTEQNVTQEHVAKDPLLADGEDIGLHSVSAGIGDIDPPEARVKKPPDKFDKYYCMKEIVRKVKKLKVVTKIEEASTACRDAGLKLCMWGSVMTV